MGKVRISASIIEINRSTIVEIVRNLETINVRKINHNVLKPRSDYLRGLSGALRCLGGGTCLVSYLAHGASLSIPRAR